MASKQMDVVNFEYNSERCDFLFCFYSFVQETKAKLRSKMPDDKATEKTEIENRKKAKAEEFERRFYRSVLAGIVSAAAILFKYFLELNFGFWPKNETADILLTALLVGVSCFIFVDVLYERKGKSGKK